MHLVFKYFHSFLRSQHGLKVQVSSKTQGKLLIVIPIKIQEYHYMLPTYNGTDSSSPFRKGRMGHSKEILDQSRTGTQEGKLQIQCSQGTQRPQCVCFVRPTNKLAFSVVVLGFGNSEGLSLD